VAKPRLSAAAIKDIRSIRAYTKEQFGSPAAAAYLLDIDNTLILIGERPMLGRSEDRLELGLRSFPCRLHRIYYRSAVAQVEISRILHQAQDAVGQFSQS
jgi:toxin ParE1/3/4